MDTLTEGNLRELMDFGAGQCVSIYLPTQSNGALEAGEDAVRLKNLVNASKAQLVASGCDPDQVDKLLAPAYHLPTNEDFWRRRGDGLALFLSDAGMKAYRLPLQFAPQVHVSESFFVTPLLQLLSGQQNFYILAISRGSARLFEGDKFSTNEVEVPDLPASMDDAQWFKESDKLLQFRSSSNEAGSYHGEGDDTRQPNSDEREYLLKVDAAVRKYLVNRHEPLIIIGLSPLPGLYSGLTKYHNLAGEIEHNAESSPEELHRLAWSLIEPLTHEPLLMAKDAYASLAAREPSRTSSDPEIICAAAEEGRVDILLMAAPVPHKEVMAFGERIESAHIDAPTRPMAEFERASRAVLSSSGQVLLVPSDEMPDGTQMAAILRY